MSVERAALTGIAALASRMGPVIDRARSQHLGARRCEGAPDCPLHRAASLGRGRTSLAQGLLRCAYRVRIAGCLYSAQQAIAVELLVRWGMLRPDLAVRALVLKTAK